MLLRLNWGWQFFQAGKGKLQNITPVIEFFHNAGIPIPVFNAYLVGSVECLGGFLLMIGLASRIVTIPLSVIMFVAYLMADRVAFFSFFSDPESFVKAAPFPFLMTVLIVMIFGPGFFSVDSLRPAKPDPR